MFYTEVDSADNVRGCIVVNDDIDGLIIDAAQWVKDNNLVGKTKDILVKVRGSNERVGKILIEKTRATFVPMSC